MRISDILAISILAMLAISQGSAPIGVLNVRVHHVSNALRRAALLILEIFEARTLARHLYMSYFNHKTLSFAKTTSLIDQ